jgi:hypothetical protein
MDVLEMFRVAPNRIQPSDPAPNSFWTRRLNAEHSCLRPINCSVKERRVQRGPSG